jgi:hypothetical protein
LKKLLEARLTVARLEQMAVNAEIEALEDQISALTSMQPTRRLAVWDVKAASTHNKAIMSVLLNTEEPTSPQQIADAMRVAGREPPTQIGFYINQLHKARAIRRVAHGFYRPTPVTAGTAVFFPDGYAEDGEAPARWDDR